MFGDLYDHTRFVWPGGTLRFRTVLRLDRIRVLWPGYDVRGTYVYANVRLVPWNLPSARTELSRVELNRD